MCWASLGSMAIEATERLRVKSAEETVVVTLVNDVPPSVDLNRPTPASESEEPFGSPVPTQTVSPEPRVTEPIALDGRFAPMAVHVGVAASASVVFQRPPPAVPA